VSSHGHRILNTHAGFILSEREHNGYQDSDWSIDFWCPESEKLVQSYHYATTRGPFGEHNSPLCGSLPEVLPAVEHAVARFLERQHRATLARVFLRQIEDGAVFKGDRVTVARGRKVPRGTFGEVLFVRPKTTHTSRFGTWSTVEDFAMVKTPEGNYWEVNAKHLEVIQRGPILQDLFDYAD
jgi:hypothetical protein